MSQTLSKYLSNYLQKTRPTLLKTTPSSLNQFTHHHSAPQIPGGLAGEATPSSQEDSLRWDSTSLADSETVAAKSEVLEDLEARVFIQPGGYPVTESSLNRILRPYFNKLGISGSTHLIRHTVATHLIQAGMPLRYVQELLGHESLQSTLVYVHLAIKDLQKEYKRTHPRERL